MNHQAHFSLANPKYQKPILCDATWSASAKALPCILFIHGFKGFKDWGTFNLMADWFASHGYCFVKLNLSHNGTTLAHPNDFDDLEAFGQNNHSIETNDVRVVIDSILGHNPVLPHIDPHRFYLMGHSRGGATAVITTAEDPRVKKLCTLASLVKIKERFEPYRQEWEAKGVIHIWNGRTNQQMPMYQQYLQDLDAHPSRFDIVANAAKIQVPFLAIHGTADETVAFAESQLLPQANPSIQLVLIEGANHTFGAKHPWESTDLLPPPLLECLDQARRFFDNKSQ